MAGTVANTNNEPVWVIYNDILLGLGAEGDVTVTIEDNWNDKMSHQTGSSVIESFWGGQNVTVQFTIAEVLTLANWVVAFSNAELQNDATNNRVAGNIIAEAETASQYIGQRATAKAQQLRLSPVREGNAGTPATESDHDFVLPLAWCRNAGDILFAIESGNELECTMQGLFDPAATLGENLWMRGLTTGAWVAGVI